MFQHEAAPKTTEVQRVQSNFYLIEKKCPTEIFATPISYTYDTVENFLKKNVIEYQEIINNKRC